jgi:Fe/S biogenesis protein NfuA
MHGGFVKLVKVEDRDVFLEMGGGCQGCAASQATLRQGIEAAIRDVAPQVRNVVDVTDHAAGTNPYIR